MTTPEHDDLEKQLTDLTQWQGASPQLWRKAMRTVERRRPILARILTGAVAACVVFGFISVFAWQITQVESKSEDRPQAIFLGDLRGLARRESGPTVKDGLSAQTRYGYQVRYGVPGSAICPSSEGERVDLTDNPQQYWDFTAAGVTASGPHTADQADRKVVRRVTIQLSTPDVRAVYLKASHLISEAKGEYVQDSALTGADNQLQANLTLRVAADRLPEVLNQLRELGKVESEQANGEDVTQQVVDNDARLRNEQRVEAELLKLFETRKDAGLDDILKLRDKLSEVRNSIERLVAERDRLSRLVNLATVLILIRPANQPVVVAQTSLRDYFTRGIAKAWNSALRLLADTVAMLLAVVVGGLIWWVLLGIAIMFIVRFWRRRFAR
jgi:hypothetical protein